MALEVVKERENRGDEQLDNFLWLIWMWNVGEKEKSQRIPKFWALDIGCLVPFAEMSNDMGDVKWFRVEHEMPITYTTGNAEQADGNESLDFKARQKVNLNLGVIGLLK